MQKSVLIGVIVIVLLGVGIFVFTGTKVTNPSDAASGDVPKEIQPSAKIPTKIALLDTTGEGTGKSRGCDTVSIVTREVTPGRSPLRLALDILFAEPEGQQPSKEYNFLARTKDTLRVGSIEVKDGTANIHLEGELSGLAGTCDDPRAAIQLEETMLQFPGIESVQLYLNGEKTTLTPNQKGEE